MPDTEYTLADLADLADVTPRTIRYYVAQGLLPSPGLGTGVRYGEGHLSRLRLIRRLQRGHLPLAEIRSRLAALSDDEVAAILQGPQAQAPGTALDYVRSVLGEVRPSPAAGAQPPAPTQARALARGAPDLRYPPPVPRPSVPLPAVPSVPDPNEPSPGAPDRASIERRLQVGTIQSLQPMHPTEPERSQWDRIRLSPDVELHLRRPLDRTTNKRVERLLALARELFEEDRP